MTYKEYQETTLPIGMPSLESKKTFRDTYKAIGPPAAPFLGVDIKGMNNYNAYLEELRLI